MKYILEHTTLGFCWWDIPAFLILIAVIAIYAVKTHNMKKEEKKLEDQLSELYTHEAMVPGQSVR